MAVGHGHAALAHRLTALGAAMPTLSPEESFVAAVLAGDAAAVTATSTDVVSAVRDVRPALMVWAAAHGRIAAVELLSDNGFDIDAMGRSDIEVDQPWQTALHAAVERGDAALCVRLLELGADPAIRDARFDSTPAQWAPPSGPRRPHRAVRELTRRSAAGHEAQLTAETNQGFAVAQRVVCVTPSRVRRRLTAVQAMPSS